MRLLLITESEAKPDLLRRVLPALAEVADGLLLRWPGLSARRCHELASELSSISPRPSLLMSDRFDLALSAGLEGVQLRESSLPVGRVRSYAPHLIIGASRHDERGIARARGADYVCLGPFAATKSKPAVAPLAAGTFSRAVAAATMPVLALGGVNAENVAEAIGLGASGCAVISAVFDSDRPVKRAQRLREALDAALRASGDAR